MIDQLWQFAISNVVLASGLAAIAWAVQVHGRWPQVAHLLWLLVLTRLVVPPVVPVPAFTDTGPLVTALDTIPVRSETPLLSPDAAAPGESALPRSADHSIDSPTFATFPIETVKLSLLLIWGAGSVILLAWTVAQFHRFNAHLRRCATDASPHLRETVSEIARSMRLKTYPRTRVTAAQLPPMVWSGRRVQLLMPEALMRHMDAEQLRGVLAHELAHVRRRDHWVRWLEWSACILFW